MADLLNIDPSIFASIKDFDWMVRSLAQGEFSGKKHSKRVGVGMEFSQYRPYSQGDDLRQLDWKMYARSDRFYIKQSEVETNINVTFVLDQTDSMSYRESGLSKLEYGKLLTAVLARLSMNEGDWVNMAGNMVTKPGNDQRHWLRLLNHLNGLDTSGKFEIPFIENTRSKELFVVVSDLYEESEEWLGFIKSLKTRRNEVVIFHLLGEKEKNLDFGSGTAFRDLENGQLIQADATTLKSTYTKNLHNWLQKLKDTFSTSGISYQQIEMGTPIADVINHFVHQRKRLG